MATTWITDATCLTHEDGGWISARRSIEIASGRIVALHHYTPYIAPEDEVIVGTGLLAIPGLVNAHTHSPDNLLRGSAPQLPLELWSLHSAAGREGRTPRQCYISAALGGIEMLRTGTTALLDHVRISPELDGACLDAIAQAYLDLGLRAVVAPIVADRPVASTLPLDSDDLRDLDLSAYGMRALLPASEQIAIAEAFVERWHGCEQRIMAGIGPSAPQRCSDDLLIGAAALAARHSLILHLHALETRAQQIMGHRLYGKGTVAHLDDLGLLGPKTNLAHAIWIEGDDLDRIARTDTAIIHNPVSNARLGSGFCPLADYLERGIRVGLGTDSACCNDSNNLFETTKWAGLLHNPVRPHARWLGAAAALRLATQGSADAIGLGSSVGNLAPGQSADITMLRLDTPAFTPLNDVVRQLVLSENGSSVVHVVVAGETVLRGGVCTRLNESAIWEEAQEYAARQHLANCQIQANARKLAAPIEAMFARIGRDRSTSQ
ncbi:amidohydrolase family protein [Devosia sp. BK]|uniref:amidohydrolase family protein n=1 Tax=Devosia sp. BK TaxID=2871706 RepID=UPI00293B486B|nr:amidohydrolase family protein [Devosia sp. BK]MDV3253719.1 amidohydrolase family protein [Devosia sp. BK]